MDVCGRRKRPDVLRGHSDTDEHTHSDVGADVDLDADAVAHTRCITRYPDAHEHAYRHAQSVTDADRDSRTVLHADGHAHASRVQRTREQRRIRGKRHLDVRDHREYRRLHDSAGPHRRALSAARRRAERLCDRRNRY